MPLTESTVQKTALFMARALLLAREIGTERAVEAIEGRARHLDHAAAELVEIVENEDREFGAALRAALNNPERVIARYGFEQAKRVERTPPNFLLRCEDQIETDRRLPVRPVQHEE